VFNRPDHTQKVFSQIRRVKPSRLYISADGPRTENEAAKVEAVRHLILTGIDWECEVKTNFKEQNLGCREAVSRGISWFFQNEEMGIVLEDDCLPELSFFYYCQELLYRFKDESEIGIISSGLINTSQKYSYSFINYPLIWGWASWRRVWENYDVEASFIKSASEIKRLTGLRYSSNGVIRFWSTIYGNVTNINTWDYQLTLLFLKLGLKAVYPNHTLVQNIGLTGESTHHFDNSFAFSAVSHPIEFPLLHPKQISINRQVQEAIERAIFYEKPFLIRAVQYLLRTFNLRS